MMGVRSALIFKLTLELSNFSQSYIFCCKYQPVFRIAHALINMRIMRMHAGTLVVYTQAIYQVLYILRIRKIPYCQGCVSYVRVCSSRSGTNGKPI